MRARGRARARVAGAGAGTGAGARRARLGYAPARMSDPRERRSAPAAADPAASGVALVRVAAQLREAIAEHSSPGRADDVVRRAIAASERTSVPRSAQAVRAFVEGSLLDTARAELGAEVASAIAARLAPLLSSLARLESEAVPAAPDATAPEITIGVRTVRVAIGIGLGSEDREAIEAALPGVATDWIGAFDRLDPVLLERIAAPRAIVVECRRANPLVPRVIALEPALLDDALLVLWGPSRIEETQVRRQFPCAIVAACARDATAHDVATLIRIGVR